MAVSYPAPQQAAAGTSDAFEVPEVVELVNRVIRERDRNAFAELYQRYLDRVFRYLYYRTGLREDAEDLTEQVFLQAWRGLPKFRWQGKPFQAWLYTLAHNALIDHRRSNPPASSLDDLDHPLQVPDDSIAPELAQFMDTDMLARAVSRLPADQQQVIVLRFVDGHDAERVAKLLGKRLSFVRAQQFQALRSLRRVLERQLAGEAV
jgi:RNA polymerase sigma-70 factor (ECF subfamily)